MLNCLQVKSILCATPEELQDTVNDVLIELGIRVHDVHSFAPIAEGFAANVVYWSQDTPATITVKCEEYATDNPGTEPLFVAVLSEGQRSWAYNALDHMVRLCEKNAENAKMTGNATEYNAEITERDIYIGLLKRFEPDEEETV